MRASVADVALASGDYCSHRHGGVVISGTGQELQVRASSVGGRDRHVQGRQHLAGVDIGFVIINEQFLNGADTCSGTGCELNRRIKGYQGWRRVLVRVAVDQRSSDGRHAADSSRGHATHRVGQQGYQIPEQGAVLQLLQRAEGAYSQCSTRLRDFSESSGVRQLPDADYVGWLGKPLLHL